MRYIAPPIDIFWSHDKLPKYAESLHNLLYDVDIAKNPLIVQNFSSGGCFVYQSFRRILKTDPNICQIGLAFDSCPAQRNNWRRSKAAVEVFRPRSHPLVKCALVLCFYAFFNVQSIIFWVRKLFGWKLPHFATEYSTEFARDPLDCPKLFLYSDADDLCPADFIAKFVEQQRKRGDSLITEKRWKDSPHCQHLRMHQSDYEKAVETFLDQSMHYYYRKFEPDDSTS